MNKNTIIFSLLGIIAIVFGVLFTKGIVLYGIISLSIALILVGIIKKPSSPEGLQKITQEDIQQAVKEYQSHTNNKSSKKSSSKKNNQY